jgi:hypothetical protein
MNHLKKALTINALFSSISGIILILLNRQIADIFGTKNNTVFWCIGVALIYFALTIWYERTKQRKLAVLWIIIQDFLWVLGSIILISFNPFQVTQNGTLIIGVVSVIVLSMGVNQIIAYHKTKHKRITNQN